jgi:hypothetical protein
MLPSLNPMNGNAADCHCARSEAITRRGVRGRMVIASTPIGASQ